MVWFPPAKINLGLHVLRKRTDGFHDIETCFYPVKWLDILEIIPADNFQFTSSGLEIAGNKEENLCVKAYQIVQEKHNIPPVHIHLHKVIPMGAGLGGGSSDAAFTLKGLNEIFELDLSVDQLHKYAAQLGSDCAFFLFDKPMMAYGRGEELEPVNALDLSDHKILLVYPEIHVPTAAAYSKLTPNDSRPSLKSIVHQDIRDWKKELINDFEKSVFEEHPEIKAIKEKLYSLGAEYASMSGSGSAVYGIFSHIDFDIKKEFPSVKVFTQEL